MNRNVVIIVAFAILMFGGAWLWSSLQMKATEAQLARITAALDQTEQDMGIYNLDSSRTEPIKHRAQNVTREMDRKVKEQRRLFDSLARAEREDLGDHTISNVGADAEITPR